MPIPATPGRADIAKIARGDASALEQLYLWMDAVSRTLAQNGLGQQPVAPTSGGTVAWPPDEQPATSASGVVAVAVRFADGTFGYVDPDVFVNAQPSLGAYWRTDGSSSPSTGPWELEFDLTMSDGSEITLNAASPSSDQATITPSTGTWDNGATAMEISATGLVFSNNSQLGSLVATTLTGTRTWTFPDASGTLALLEVAQSWTATQTIGAAAWINFTPSTTQSISAAGNTIIANAGTVNLSNAGGNITLTSTPTIADGDNGQDLVIHNLLASTGRVVLRAESGLAGSNLYLGAATRALLPGGMIHLRFLSAESRWVEIAFVTSTS